MISYKYKDNNEFNTNMYKLMKFFKDKNLNYKWLITDIETTDYDFLNEEYIIINHQDLMKLLEKIKIFSGYGQYFLLYHLNIVMMIY